MRRILLNKNIGERIFRNSIRRQLSASLSILFVSNAAPSLPSFFHLSFLLMTFVHSNILRTNSILPSPKITCNRKWIFQLALLPGIPALSTFLLYRSSFPFSHVFAPFTWTLLLYVFTSEKLMAFVAWPSRDRSLDRNATNSGVE